jgi:hypothetical protein
MKLKVIISVILVLVLSLSLISCGDRVKKSEAKETAEAFLSAIAGGDFESAKSYLHPEKPLDLQKYFDAIEGRVGVDFQAGIELKRYTDYSSSVYESEVDGSEYDLEANIIVDGVAFEFSVEIVRNDLGYGIYSFEVDYND